MAEVVGGYKPLHEEKESCIVRRLQTFIPRAWKNGSDFLINWVPDLREVRDFGLYKKLKCKTFEQYVDEFLGCTFDMVETALVASDAFLKKTTNDEYKAWTYKKVATEIETPAKRGEVGRGRTADRFNNVKSNATPDLAYTLRRLKRDSPKLFEKVVSGELSANAAAIKAGFRVKTITVPLDAERAAKTIRKHFTAAQIHELMEYLA